MENLIGKRVNINPKDKYWTGDTLPKVVEIEDDEAILVYDTISEPFDDCNDQSQCFGASYFSIPVSEAKVKIVS